MTHREKAYCDNCGNIQEFKHMHNTAYGIPGTHFSGSERWECTLCGNAVYADYHAARNFKFVLDVVPEQEEGEL